MPLNDMLFSFQGRIRRRDWWIWSIAASFAWTMVLTAVGAALFGVSWTTSLRGGAGFPTGWTFTAYGLVTFLPLLWVQAALAAKRAHDRNHEALVAVGLTGLVGIVSFAPEVVDLITNAGLTDSQFNTLNRAVSLAIVVINLYLVVTLGFLDGTQGPNRFGRSPKGLGGDPADKAADVFS